MSSLPSQRTARAKKIASAEKMNRVKAAKRQRGRLATLTMAVVAPCGCAVRLRVLELVPRETYSRKTKCGRQWEIARTLLSTTARARMDKLEWEEIT